MMADLGQLQRKEILRPPPPKFDVFQRGRGENEKAKNVFDSGGSQQYRPNNTVVMLFICSISSRRNSTAIVCTETKSDCKEAQ